MKNHREDLAANFGKKPRSIAETFIPESAADEKTVGFMVYLPESVRKALKYHAFTTDRSMSDIVRTLITDYLNELENEH